MVRDNWDRSGSDPIDAERHRIVTQSISTAPFRVGMVSTARRRNIVRRVTSDHYFRIREISWENRINTMPGFRLKNVSLVPGTIDVLLREWFGYEAVNQEGEWYVPESDRALRNGPIDALHIHPRINLAAANFKQISEQLSEIIPSEFDEFIEGAQSVIPKHIELPGGLGLLSDLNLLTTKLAVSKRSKIQGILQNELLPFMVEKFSATYVVPVTVAASRQQQHFSFSKVALLAERFGVGRLDEFRNKESFAGIEMSGGLDILYFVDAMTRLAPMVFTLPVRYLGCTWHFHGEGFAIHPPLCNHGLFQDFLPSINPRHTEITMDSFIGLKNMDGDNVWRHLRQCVLGVNNIMKYLNNPLNFVNENEEVDFAKQLQGYGALHLLFGDLLAMSLSVEPHNQTTFAL